MKIMIIIPAWNEEKSITFSLESILNQTRIPDRIIVVPNNTSDQTIKVATSIDAAVEILEMPGFNKDKKAGAINYALNNLAEVLNLWEDSAVLIMDADTIIEPNFIEKAESKMRENLTIGGVGSIFTGRKTDKFLGLAQRMEYIRYANVIKRRPEAYVLSGTASLFRWSALKDVKKARQKGTKIPKGKDYYDTQSLTEDNEITFALHALGYTTPTCGVHSITDIMETTKDLYHQRKRWYLGALQNILAYAWKMPKWARFIYWRQQIGLLLSLILFPIMMIAFKLWMITGFQTHYIFVTIFSIIIPLYLFVQVITVWKLGWKARLVALLYIPEILYSILLIIFYGVALVNFITKKNVDWRHT